mmetsp:Transcript_17772/g.32168  ORF Transcript_17772/g.32168 Transcript_17772/m.32168 type:complete len:96 (+) Transcript_17772:423-710(+)
MLGLDKYTIPSRMGLLGSAMAALFCFVVCGGGKTIWGRSAVGATRPEDDKEDVVLELPGIRMLEKSNAPSLSVTAHAGLMVAILTNREAATTAAH